MHIIAGTLQSLGTELTDRLWQYRYKVFVERLGWRVPSVRDRERDQFDRQDTFYVIALEHDRIVGCCRLLPTTQPYLISEVMPELLIGQPPPHSEKIWELSRFASTDLIKVTGAPRDRYSPLVTRKLLHASMDSATSLGAEWLISSSPPGVKRLLRSLGIAGARTGPLRLVGGHPVLACWIPLTSRPVPIGAQRPGPVGASAALARTNARATAD